MSTSVEHLCMAADDEVEAAWEAVADVREADVSAGKVIPIRFEKAIARLKARFQRGGIDHIRMTRNQNHCALQRAYF